MSTPVKDSPAGRLAANERYMSYTGRLRDGVDRAQAESQAQIVAARIAAARPREGAGAWANVTGVWLNNPDGFGATIATVLAVPGIVLAIACLNAANLLLARGTRRAREFAVRLALGATRWRIVRLLLVDSVLLSLVAAAASLPLVHWSLSLVTVFFKLPMPIDGRVLAFTMSIAVVSAIAFSLAPALRLAAVTPGAALGSSRVGAAIGAAGAVVISKVVQSQMHGAKGMDLGIFAASVAVLGAAMLLASAIPARRASLVDPITVLRQE